jgi:glycerol-3-phosphate dehydrogenase (NAD(P)+)
VAKNSKLGVIGCGAFGIALACVLHRSGNEVVIWGRDKASIDEINVDHKTSKIKGLEIPKQIKATNDLSMLKEVDYLFIVIPTQNIRDFLDILANAFDRLPPLIICAKGIENDTLLLPSQIIEEKLPAAKLSIVSGPNFAHELAFGLPASTSIACQDKDLLAQVVSLFHDSNIRPYPTSDVIGVQVAGAVKNVLAIACGICIGKNLGENAKAAIITRGTYEIGKLIDALAGKKETLLEAAGIGDICLTCNSLTSRNMHFGKLIGEGKDHEAFLKDHIVEGYYTVKSVINLAQLMKVDMPISTAVHDIIYKKADLDEIIIKLMRRNNQ